MDAHVGKPFDLTHLVNLLLRHTGRPTVPVVGAGSETSALPAELLEEAGRRGIDLATAIGRMRGNSQAYVRALESFCKDLATLPAQLNTLLEQGRFDELRRLMHTFKGLAGTLGIRRLATMAAHAEDTFDSDAAAEQQGALIEQLGALAAATMSDITHVTDAVRQSLPQPDLRPHPGLNAALAEHSDIPGLRRSLDELTSLLRSADMSAVEVFEQLQQSHAAGIPDALRPLDEAMASLDFDQALSHCEALKESLAQ